MAGTISRWAPPTAEDQALWHMAHDDDDAEDLDEEEVRDGLAEYEAQQGIEDVDVEGEEIGEFMLLAYAYAQSGVDSAPDGRCHQL